MWCIFVPFRNKAPHQITVLSNEQDSFVKNIDKKDPIEKKNIAPS